MTTSTLEQAQEQSGRRPSVVAYAIYCEVMKLLRIPAFTIPTLLFPIMFFSFFGLPNLGNTLGGIEAGSYMLASYGAYAVMSVALFSFGVSVAAERGLGWNKLLRTTPLNPLAYFTAKIVMAIIIGLITVVLLFGFGALVGISMPTLTWVKLIGLLMVGMVPFVALGLGLGYIAGPNSAAAIANMIFLPLSFASGLFMPLPFLPQIVQDIAPYLPAYHVGQLGWTALGAQNEHSLGYHLLWVAGYTAIFLALAVVAYRRDEGKNYG
jgi:ABC-2 type transport system permease protein